MARQTWDTADYSCTFTLTSGFGLKNHYALDVFTTLPSARKGSRMFSRRRGAILARDSVT
jgi:hypothetical protein